MAAPPAPAKTRVLLMDQDKWTRQLHDEAGPRAGPTGVSPIRATDEPGLAHGGDSSPRTQSGSPEVDVNEE